MAKSVFDRAENVDGIAMCDVVEMGALVEIVDPNQVPVRGTVLMRTYTNFVVIHSVNASVRIGDTYMKECRILVRILGNDESVTLSNG